MEKPLEIVLIKALCPPLDGGELFWLLGRSQLEFVLKNVDLFSSPSRILTARYQDSMVPVISFEKYFGIDIKGQRNPQTYLVIRAVNDKNEMIKLIIQAAYSFEFHKLETNFPTISPVHFSQNCDDVLGVYALAENKIAVVPDIAKIAHSVNLK